MKSNSFATVRLLSSAAAFFLLFALASFAQSPNTGALVVTVLDQNGAVVPGANITVTNTATGATRDGVSGSEGSAVFAALSVVGEYKVAVNKSGFNTDEASGLVLRAGQTAQVNA